MNFRIKPPFSMWLYCPYNSLTVGYESLPLPPLFFDVVAEVGQAVVTLPSDLIRTNAQRCIEKAKKSANLSDEVNVTSAHFECLTSKDSGAYSEVSVSKPLPSIPAQ